MRNSSIWSCVYRHRSTSSNERCLRKRDRRMTSVVNEVKLQQSPNTVIYSWKLNWKIVSRGFWFDSRKMAILLKNTNRILVNSLRSSLYKNSFNIVTKVSERLHRCVRVRELAIFFHTYFVIKSLANNCNQNGRCRIRWIINWIFNISFLLHHFLITAVIGMQIFNATKEDFRQRSWGNKRSSRRCKITSWRVRFVRHPREPHCSCFRKRNQRLDSRIQ